MLSSKAEAAGVGPLETKSRKRRPWRWQRPPLTPETQTAATPARKMYGSVAFGETIRALRLNKKLSQTQLAIKIGRTGATVSLYETGARRPDLDALKRLSATLGISVSRLSSLL